MLMLNLMLGDCLERMRELPDCSVDACVTDPPYGLSPDTPKAIADRVSRFLSKLMLPNFEKHNAELAQQIDLTGIPLDGSDLSRRKIFAVVESRVGVPERAINLDGGVQVRQKEVKACAESTACASNGELPFKADPTPCEFLGDYILDFRDTLDAAARDVLGCGFTEFSPSGITMPVTPLFLPGRVCSLSRLILGSTADLGHDVGTQHNARGHSGAASDIGASGGTVDAWMLRFDLARRAIELVATDRASQTHGFSQSAAPKLVRAGAATSSLAAKFESHRVSLVFPTANGTRAFHLHVWLPSNLWSLLTSILPRGGFMGKGWDHSVPSVEVWREVWRVLKPGAHLLAFFGTRTYHRGVVAIEDAGFEIRDQIGWAFGSGFPKSHDVSKAIDAAAGAVREVVGSVRTNVGMQGGNFTAGSQSADVPVTIAATPDAQRWAGWGTALKPAWEPIVVARKPLEGTVAANVLTWGTGAINVDGCRVGTESTRRDTGSVAMWTNTSRINGGSASGRWPANLIHDGSDEVVGLFPGENESSAARFFYCAKASLADREDGLYSQRIINVKCEAWDNAGQQVKLRVDTAQSPPRVIAVSGAECSSVTEWSMFLFGSENVDACQTACRCITSTGISSTTESKTLNCFLRWITSGTMEDVSLGMANGGSHVENAGSGLRRMTITSDLTVLAHGVERAASKMQYEINVAARACDHPTIKPTDLMRYLCRLVTPPGGVVLDPFMGSGSTGRGAVLEGLGFIGCEMDPEYLAIARARIAAVVSDEPKPVAPVGQLSLFG